MTRTSHKQCIPLILTVVTFLFLCLFLYGFILILNFLPTQEKVQFSLRKRDVLVGLTIYLKTSIDFAIFIGNLMRGNPGWKNRIAIEIGTTVGNALGTLAVLTIWNFFREVTLLMAFMIILASFVLLKMAEESFEEFKKNKIPVATTLMKLLFYPFKKINHLFSPVLNKLVPRVGIAKVNKMPWIRLAFFSFTIPFILGLDDFAGYIPLFSVINVFGFAIGVFLGHMLLTAALFLSPKRTIAVVKHPLMLFMGTLAFIAIALFGFLEVFRLILSLVH
ncbi:MAG: hypothetical protein A3G13_02700 [Candidatus Levybacteria bacterium RIFCSPLOWO2_12_FULL_37_7]|nr:MAG: hypothetical protein A3G13_02700 [Candidatus Levybacteria bacterium RIFCSPLOWO2_12_FULL_37_7]